jgi:hypothetical protein
MTHPPAGRPAISAVAADIIAESAPEYLDELAVAAVGFFGSEPARRAMVRRVLVGRSGPGPNAIDAVSGALVVQTVLVLLQAVATDTASDLIRRGIGNGVDFLRRRRAGRDVARAGAQLTAQTPVPAVPASQAQLIGDLARQLIIASKGDPAVADMIAAVLTEAVSDAPYRARPAAIPRQSGDPSRAEPGE